MQPNSKLLVTNFRRDNPLVVNAWLDREDRPTVFHIRHRKKFNLHTCKMPQDLAKLRLDLQYIPARARKPRV